MDTSTQQYRLRWNNHRSNLLTVFEELLENEAFTDVTLAVENGASVKCHKMVLAACSLYFQNLFITLPCKHPIIVLKDVKHREIKAILEYMYRGEVNVAHDHLPGLLKVAEILKVKGLIEQNGIISRNILEQEEGVETTSSPPPAISTSTATSSTAAQSSAHASVSPGPHSTENVYSYMYGKHPLVDGGHFHAQPTPETLPLHMWPLSAGLPLSQHHSSMHRQSILQSQRSLGLPRNFEEDSKPPPALCLKRKFPNLPANRDTPILRTVLGQGHADSSQPVQPARPDSRDNNYQGSGSGSSHEIDRRSSTDRSYGSEPTHNSHLEIPPVADEEDKQPSPQSYTGDSKPGIAGFGASQKPEWKRYKQYTREDMMSAIEAVKSGMSALQAARKYGVPPRTLYDKVKKMGITTTRPLKRGINGSAACFPYGIGGNVNGSIYGSGFYETESEGTGVGAVLENSSPANLDSSYGKWRDVPVDTGHRFGEPLGSPSGQRDVKQQPEDEVMEEEEDEEDQVEDLSVTRKPDVGVIVPPNPLVKEESNISSDNVSNN